MNTKNWALMCVAGLLMSACVFTTKKTETLTADSLAVDSTDVGALGFAGDADTVISIYKMWISEDGDHLFDLRDDTHYVEAMKYDEAYCKENPDYKPGVFYITTEAGGWQIGHNFDDEPDTVGWVEYLLDEGPYAGTYAMRFSFRDMTPKTATFTFELDYDWKYKVLDEPVELLPDPHPYVYEE